MNRIVGNKQILTPTHYSLLKYKRYGSIFHVQKLS